jgi:uncharacterized iron-regulated protein
MPNIACILCISDGTNAVHEALMSMMKKTRLEFAGRAVRCLSAALFFSAVLIPLSSQGAERRSAALTGIPSGALPQQQNCAENGRWLVLDGKKTQISTGNLVIGAAAQREVVLLGEDHDNEDHHRWQLQTLAVLHAQRPDLVIGFEMFPRRLQPVLDRWVQGKLSPREFFAQTEWDRVWGQPAELYLPLFEFARINRIPMVALNIDQKLTRAIGEKGWDAIPPEAREGVSRAAPPLPAYREFLSQIFREHGPARPGKSTKPDPAFNNFVDAQTAWDRAMAEALVQRLNNGKATDSKPLLVGIMGSGHLRFGYGVPHQLRDLGVTNPGVLIPLTASADCRELRAGFADAVFIVPDKPLISAEPPRLGVQLEDVNGTVRVAAVTAGSLAEKTGLKAGDRLLEVASRPAEKTTAVIATIRRQTPGTWLPLRVQRGDANLDLVVRFPATP